MSFFGRIRASMRVYQRICRRYFVHECTLTKKDALDFYMSISATECEINHVARTCVVWNLSSPEYRMFILKSLGVPACNYQRH